MEATLSRNGGGPNIAVIMIVGLMLVALAIPAVVHTIHAGLHTEADEIRQCFGDGRINQIWINSSGERLNCLVDTPDGRVGDYVIQWCKRLKWVEATAYVINYGTLTEAVRILKAKNCTQVYP